MKSVTQQTLDEITMNHHNEVGYTLHAEWQMNRFFNTLVDNTPSEDDEAFDIEYFPIDSITEPNRPTSGICKAIVGQSLVEAKTKLGKPPASRFYTADTEDDYQYWQSPVSSNATGTFPLFNSSNFPETEGVTYNYDGVTCVRPTVTYAGEDTVDGNGDFVDGAPRTVKANKITFTVENTYAYPVDYDVEVQYDVGGPWTTVAGNLAIPSNGKVELWFNGTNWTTTQDLSQEVLLSAIRLVVRQMNKESYFNLIELGACLEKDLSSDLVSWSDSFTMGERDFITPLGNISMNEGQVVLWSGSDGTYMPSNSNGPYYGLLDKGVLLRLWSEYDADSVLEFAMFSNDWAKDSDEATMVSLVDDSEFFMTRKPKPMLYRDITVQEAVWRVCDVIGFNNYEVETLDETATIDIFWTDGVKTAWEVFGELSRATQTAIYFDSRGVLNIKTRGAAWNNSKTPAYSFIKDSVPGGQPSNIESLSESGEYEANRVVVNWHPTSFSQDRDNITPFDVVWEPEGTVVLRSTPLEERLLVGHKTVRLPKKEGKTWPWKGYMNIEGEWIEFDAKKYVYQDESGVRRTAWIQSYDEQKKKDALGGPFKRHVNSYTGHLRIAERGLWGTEETDHRLDLNSWTKTRRKNFAFNRTPCSGIHLNRNDSSVTISGPGHNQRNDYTYLHHGRAIDQGYKYIGARIKIDKSSHKHKLGGIFFAANAELSTGYFLEIVPTSKLNGKTRNRRNEILFYSMNQGGDRKAFGGRRVKIRDRSRNNSSGSVTTRAVGARAAIIEGRYVDIDMWVETGGDDHKITVFVNGRPAFTAVVPLGSGYKQPNGGRMGLYTRGHSSMTAEYIYGVNSVGIGKIDSETYYDRLEDGYYSTQSSDWTFHTRSIRRKVRRRRKRRRKGKKWRWVWRKYTKRYRQRFFDDFGPIAHEMREFDVKFTGDLPALESKLYFSNTSQVVCSEFTGDISGARFIMANVSRENAIVSGDDEKTAAGGGTINHKLFVYGRPVKQEEPQSLIKEDGWSIRRRGIIELEYSSPWIQNEDEAELFGDWLTTNWSRSDSSLELVVFGNPLLEISDVVSVSYDTIDDNFYVVGVSNSSEGGLSTTLTLRKAG